MAQSPELAGGAGFTFEDTISASYLTALLQEGYAPGVENRIVCRVALQQRDSGEPLDDVIVDFKTAASEMARLSLQVKRALIISQAKSNTDFGEIIRDSWNTLTKKDFRLGVDRFGAAVGQVASGKSRDLRTLCEFARANEDTADFEARFSDSGNASLDIREVRDDIVALIEEASGSSCTKQDAHKFFSHFVLIEFDFLHEGGTSLSSSLNSLKTCLSANQTALAPSAWSMLCRLAREGAGKSAVYERPKLAREMSAVFDLASAPSLRSDLEKLRDLTHQWLADIEDDVGGTRLERKALEGELESSLAKSRFVQVRGLPGSGKSVLLRRRIEDDLERGSVFMLKSGRLEGSGWTSFAKANGLSAAPLSHLLAEIAATGSSTLYVDGIDRIEKAHQQIVLDVIRAIFETPLLDNWRIVVSLRDTGIEPLRNWLGSVLSMTGVGTVEVKELDDDESELLAKAQPHLRSLLFGPSGVREIVRRPFFAKVLNQNFAASAGDEKFEPRSEVDLIENWWARGGYNSDGQSALERQRAIIELGSLRARNLERDIAIGNLTRSSVAAVGHLVEDGILQHVQFGHSIRFSHDIFFEWAFFHVLADRETKWIDEIRGCGEPPAVGRVVELLSQWKYRDGNEWSETLSIIDSSQMRSQWTRAWLLGPIATPNFTQSDSVFSAAIEANDFHFLKKALVWFQAERTTPNPLILEGEMPQEQRIRIADLLGWPSDFATWARFINFLLARISTFPVSLYPDVVAIFDVWQNACSNWKNAVSNALLDQVAFWLREIEQKAATKPTTSEPSRWAPLGRERRNFRQSLTRLLLRSAVTRSDLTDSYLDGIISREKMKEDEFTEIVQFAPILAKSHPAKLVDLSLKHLKQELPEDQVTREREELLNAAETRKRALSKPPEHRNRAEELAASGHFLPIGTRSFSYHDWDALAVDRHSQNFFPPSPLREPFFSLFASAPIEALRLLAQLSNHAIAAWRQLHSLAHDSPGTPIPLDLEFPWGTHRFWGGDREYLWHRGMQAPNPIACGYMALEEWVLSELQRGQKPEDLIQQILAGNECIAVLGSAVVIALQSETVSETIFPLVTSQRLLSADHRRWEHDIVDSTTSLIGFTAKEDRPHIEAIKVANGRPVRSKELRWLVSNYFLSDGAELAERIKAAVESFPSALPFQIEEHKTLPEAKQYLTEQANQYAELVNIENYRRVNISDDADQVAIVHVSPTTTSPQAVARAEEAAVRLKEGNIWAWAHKYFESGELQEGYTIADAIEFAKSIDSTTLFETADSDETDSMRRGAVSATAAMVLCRHDGLGQAELDWAREVLKRAIHVPENWDVFWSPQSEIPWHPAIFVARGLAADLRAGTHQSDDAANLLALVAHPLEKVSISALQQALNLWDVDPQLGWSALSLALSFCNVAPSQRTGPSAPIHSTQHLQEAIELTRQTYMDGKGFQDLPLPLPDKPEPEGTSAGRIQSNDIGDLEEDIFDDGEPWEQPSIFWYSQYAAKIIQLIPSEQILDSEAGSKLFEFLTSQLAWTISKIAPPSEESQRPSRRSTEMLEWTHALGQTFGIVAGLRPLEGVEAEILQPTFDLEGELCWELLSPFVDTYICYHVFDAKTVPASSVDLLDLCLDRLLEDSSFDPKGYRAGQFSGFDLPNLVRTLMFVSVEHASGAARFVNGDWTEIDRLLPIVDKFVRNAGWSATVMGHFLTLCERSKASYPASAFGDQVLYVLGKRNQHLEGWHGSLLPAQIAGLVQHFADREAPMPLELGQNYLRILDLLVDMGDRRSAALQLSESFREIQAA